MAMHRQRNKNNYCYFLDSTKDKSWFFGPPYAVEEVVFDEYDICSCCQEQNEIIIQRLNNLEKSAHPNFFSEDVFKITEEAHTNNYKYKSILKRDRVGYNGQIFHPYSAIRKEDGWHIKIFELFSREYSEIHENEFVQLKLSDEQAMKNRKDNFKG